MSIATIKFDRIDAEVDWNGTDIIGLKESVMTALNKYFPSIDDPLFPSFSDAARAQAEHRYVKAHVEGDPTPSLFSMNERFRAAVNGNAKALKWEAFVRDAQTGIAPYCFSIRFSRD